MNKTINNIFFLVIVLFLIVSNLLNNKIELIIQVSLYIIYLIFHLYTNPKQILWYFYPIFLMSINLIGVFLIEFFEGYYLYEVGKITYYKGSLFPITLYTLIICKILFTVNIENVNIKKRENELIDKTILMLLILIIIVFLKIIQQPIFLFHIDKYKYSKEYLNFYFQTIINIYQYYLPLFLGYIYITTFSLKTRRNIRIIIILLIIILVCIGIKFGGYFHFFYYFSLPIILLLHSKKIILKRLFAILVTTIILINFSILHRIYNYGLSGIEGIKGVFQRGFQQGQLWWATYLDNDMIYNNFILSEILNNCKKTRGIYKIMYAIADSNFVDKLYQLNSIYTASTTSTIYTYFGVKGIYIFGLVYGIVVLKTYSLIVQSLKNNILINLIFLTRILVILSSMFMVSKFYIFQLLELFVLLILTKIMLILKKRRN